MLAIALIIVGLLILVVSLPPLVLDLTGHIKYVPAGSSENWFKQTLTDDVTKYIMLGTGVLVGTVFTGLGIWFAATTRTKTIPEYSRLQYGPNFDDDRPVDMSRPEPLQQPPRQGISRGYQSIPKKPLPKLPQYGDTPRSAPMSRNNSSDTVYSNISLSPPTSEYGELSISPSSQYDEIPTEALERTKRLSGPPRDYGVIPNLPGLGQYGKTQESLGN